MARLIGSHSFSGQCVHNTMAHIDRGQVCSDCHEWHGGSKCVTCGFPRFEHEWDYSGLERESGYASGYLRELRESISDAFHMRHVDQSARAMLPVLFRILNAGADKHGSLDTVLSRNADNRIRRLLDSN